MLLLGALFPSYLAFSQTTTPPAENSATAAQNAPEITSQEEAATFRKSVNLVEVRFVVRDSSGRVVENLKQDDFQLFDNGKPQVISKFSVERVTDKPVVHSEVTATDESAAAGPVQPVLAKRFVAYLFDDMHLTQPDLTQARNAAVKNLQSLTSQDRAGVFTTSGQGQQDFTDDRAQLVSAIDHIIPRSQQAAVVRECPEITYYMADLMLNKNDQIAQQIAIDLTRKCEDPLGMVGNDQTFASDARAAARRELEIGDHEVQVSFSTIDALLRRMAQLPGQRTIVLVSSGFMNSDLLWQESELMERAVHANVVINTMDARGLYTSSIDASQPGYTDPHTSGRLEQYHIAEQDMNQVVLADIADATGGKFFHNNNDLQEGFRRLAAPPEVSYLLAFAPQGLKLDGGYHSLKVKLKPPAEGSVQARKGYFAPKTAINASEQAKAAVEDAVFSQDEVRDIPVELHTQFFKPDENDAKLSVLARVDVKSIHFAKANGRNNTDVTVVSAVFDRNGNFIVGNQKLVQLHLKDETLEHRATSGITLKSTFDVKPGSYVVRLVVRDAAGQLAARNLAVEIP